MRLRLHALVGMAALIGAFLVQAPATAHSTSSSAGTYRGEGDSLVRIPVTTKPSLVKITHQGEGHFAVWTLKPSGDKQDLVANTVGDHKGTSAFNTRSGGKVRALSVTADGVWTLQVLPITSARSWAVNAKGAGADVIRLAKPSTGLRRLTIRHSGEGHFAVWALSNDGRLKHLLVNKVGDYRGSVALPPGSRYATITADGAWSITRK